MTPLTQAELLAFYPTLLNFTVSGAIVGLVAGLSDALTRRRPNFLRDSQSGFKLNYSLIARYALRQITCMALFFGLLAYPVYSSDMMPKDEINPFIIQQALLLIVLFPIANIIESAISNG